MGSVIYVPAVGGGGGSGTVTSVNASGGTTGFSFSGGPITGAGTLTLGGVLAVTAGGTGQSNQQAALNNLTNIGAATAGDYLQFTGGNAQFAPLTLTLAEISNAIGAPANTFIFSDATSQIVGYSQWAIDDVTKFANVQLTYQPNNLSANPQALYLNVQIDPLQNSPNDSMSVHLISANLDSSANGFNFGSAGQSVGMLNVGFNYQGNGSTYGSTYYLSTNATVGNGTDPVTLKGHSYMFGFFNVAANATFDGQLQGYGFQPNFNASAISTTNTSVNAFYDFANMPVDIYGYSTFVSSPIVGTIKNNHGFNGFSTGPNITLMEGNASYTGFSSTPTIATLGTGGFLGDYVNPTITTQVSNSTIAGSYMGGQITTMGATGCSYQGYNANPTITTSHGNVYGYLANPSIAGGDADVDLYQGNMNQVTTTGVTSVLNLNGTTATGDDSACSINGVNFNVSGTMIPLSGQTVQTKHVIFTAFSPPAASTITGTDNLICVFSPGVDFGDASTSIALGPSGLGTAMVAFAGQTAGHGQMDLLSAVLPTAIFQSDFTLGEWRNVNCTVINAGYTGVCTNASAFYHEVAGAGLFATNHWGVKVVTDGVHNWMKGDLVVDGTTGLPTNASVGVEIQGTTKSLLVSRLTTTEEGALTAVNGMIIYNTTTNKFRGYENGSWVDLI